MKIKYFNLISIILFTLISSQAYCAFVSSSAKKWGKNERRSIQLINSIAKDKSLGKTPNTAQVAELKKLLPYIPKRYKAKFDKKKKILKVLGPVPGKKGVKKLLFIPMLKPVPKKVKGPVPSKEKGLKLAKLKTQIKFNKMSKKSLLKEFKNSNDDLESHKGILKEILIDKSATAKDKAPVKTMIQYYTNLLEIITNVMEKKGISIPKTAVKKSAKTTADNEEEPPDISEMDDEKAPDDSELDLSPTKKKKPIVKKKKPAKKSAQAALMKQIQEFKKGGLKKVGPKKKPIVKKQPGKTKLTSKEAIKVGAMRKRISLIGALEPLKDLSDEKLLELGQKGLEKFIEAVEGENETIIDNIDDNLEEVVEKANKGMIPLVEIFKEAAKKIKK